MKNKNNQKKTNAHVGTAVISGLAVAALVGGYFLYNNTNVKKKIKPIKGWAMKAKGEVLEKIEKIKNINEESYHKVVDTVVGKYQKIQTINTAELAALAQELKKHWKSIKKVLNEKQK